MPPPLPTRLHCTHCLFVYYLNLLYVYPVNLGSVWQAAGYVKPPQAHGTVDAGQACASFQHWSVETVGPVHNGSTTEGFCNINVEIQTPGSGQAVLWSIRWPGSLLTELDAQDCWTGGLVVENWTAAMRPAGHRQHSRPVSCDGLCCKQIWRAPSQVIIVKEQTTAIQLAAPAFSTVCLLKQLHKGILDGNIWHDKFEQVGGTGLSGRFSIGSKELLYTRGPVWRSTPVKRGRRNWRNIRPFAPDGAFPRYLRRFPRRSRPRSLPATTKHASANNRTHRDKKCRLILSRESQYGLREGGWRLPDSSCSQCVGPRVSLRSVAVRFRKGKRAVWRR